VNRNEASRSSELTPVGSAASPGVVSDPISSWWDPSCMSVADDTA
jgi:hypothetical protein